MNFWGVLLSLASIGVVIGYVYVVLKNVVYEGIYLPKKFARDLTDKVRWIAIKRYDYRDEDLIAYVLRESYMLQINQRYRINENELEFICEILETHKNHVIESFFYGVLKKEETLYQLDYVEYYMVSLLLYLEKNEIKSSFIYHNKMYNSEKADNETFYDYIYNLTEYGIAYHKLYLVVSMFCENNENTRKVILYHKKDDIKERLDNKKIPIMHYRP